MKNYIDQLDDVYTLNRQLSKVKEKIREVLPRSLNSNSRIRYTTPCPISGFLMLYAELERLLFRNSLITSNTYTACFYKKDNDFLYTIRDYVGDNDYKSGFFLIDAPRTHYTENDDFKHLTVAEETFKKDGHHFIKIFTINNNFLVVFSNKTLDFDDVIRLKMLQWSISKETIETPIEEVSNLLLAFLNRDLDLINNLLHNIVNSDEMKKIQFDKLKNLFKPNYTKRINKLNSDIERQETDYRYYEEELMKVARRINDLQNERSATIYLSEQENTDNTPILNYIFKHPYIKNITDVGDDQVKLTYEAPILYFDDFLIENIKHNYEGARQTILQAFIDNEYELMTQCAIYFNTTTFNISNSHVGNDPFIGHPHIDRHGCFGNHPRAVFEAAKTMNYLGAIDQISQAVLNINFSDAVVVRNMLNDLLSDRNIGYLKTWRHKETGVLITTEELLENYYEKITTDS